MNDELLKSLATIAREEQEASRTIYVHELEQVASGTLPEKRKVALKELAMKDKELSLAIGLFEPMGDGFINSVEKRINDERRADSVTIPIRIRRAPLIATIAGLAAAAAIVLLWMLPTKHDAPLPEYTLRVSGAVQQLRDPSLLNSSLDSPAQFLPGSILTLVARPSEAVHGQVTAKCFAQRGDGYELLAVEPQVSTKGAVRVVVEIGESDGLPRGEWTLWIAIGRLEDLPSSNRFPSGKETESVRLVKVRLKIE